MEDCLSTFVNRFADRKAVVAVVGMGYVGLPLALRYCEVGYRVLGLDVDTSKVERLNQGESYIKHIPSVAVASAAKARLLSATSDFSRIPEADAIILCVPTPLGRHREPDLSFVIDTTDAVVPHLRPGQLLSLESSTYPGTTAEEIVPRVQARSLVPGRDVFVVFSPEREDPGNADFRVQTIPKIVGGFTPQCLQAGKVAYGAIVDRVVPVSSTQVAEMAKLLENIYRSINIGLVNELKIVCDKIGIDIWEVIDAAATKPFGFTPFYPGPGLGGHCIPIDPFYLTWKAKEYEINTRFIELAGEVNTYMPEWVVHKVMDALNDREKALKNSRVLVLGVAYKKNIDDMRESPSRTIMELLVKQGAVVTYSDPFIPELPRLRNFHVDVKSVDVTPQVLSSMDCVLILTDHDEFDYQMIIDNSNLVIDTRGRLRGSYANVVRA